MYNMNESISESIAAYDMNVGELIEARYMDGSISYLYDDTDAIISIMGVTYESIIYNCYTETGVIQISTTSSLPKQISIELCPDFAEQNKLINYTAAFDFYEDEKFTKPIGYSHSKTNVYLVNNQIRYCDLPTTYKNDVLYIKLRLTDEQDEYNLIDNTIYFTFQNNELYLKDKHFDSFKYIIETKAMDIVKFTRVGD